MTLKPSPEALRGLHVDRHRARPQQTPVEAGVVLEEQDTGSQRFRDFLIVEEDTLWPR